MTTGREEAQPNKTRKRLTIAALIAGLSALTGLLSALATLYTQLQPAVAAAVLRDFAPVGTVIASLLDEATFATAVGETRGDILTKRKWILADGSKVTGTAFARATGDQPVPDLRGMFLRGVPSSGERVAGKFYPYSTARPRKDFGGTTSPAGEHTHAGGADRSNVDRYNVGGTNYYAMAPSNTSSAGLHSHTFIVTTGGDDETRPDNVTVFYYVKIN